MPCFCFDQTDQGDDLFGSTVCLPKQNRRVSTAQFVQPRVQCSLSRVECCAAESLLAIRLYEVTCWLTGKLLHTNLLNPDLGFVAQ